MLRKHGYSINIISQALGRSRSYVYRTLRFNLNIGNLRYFDMRKLPNKTRKWSSRLRWKTLMELWQKWEAWMLGEGDKPP
jgi:IS30 family transposase